MTLLSVSACSTQPITNENPASSAYFDVSRLNNVEGDYAPRQVYDPLESFNRSIYGFNYRVDKYVLLPVVSAYEAITPKFVRAGVHNFFNNIREISTLYNSVFQLNFKKS